MSCVCNVFVHCHRVVTCWERADLLALVCNILLCFRHFPMWYPGSGVVLSLNNIYFITQYKCIHKSQYEGVVLDFINSGSLLSFFLCKIRFLVQM